MAEISDLYLLSSLVISKIAVDMDFLVGILNSKMELLNNPTIRVLY